MKQKLIISISLILLFGLLFTSIQAADNATITPGGITINVPKPTSPDPPVSVSTSGPPLSQVIIGIFVLSALVGGFVVGYLIAANEFKIKTSG